MKALLFILGFTADNVQAYLLLRLREVVLCLETWHTFQSLKDARYIFFFTLQSNLMGYSVPKPSKNNYISGKYHAGVR